MRGINKEALAAFEQAILLDPSNALFYREKAATLQSLKRIEEAREAYKKARQLGEGSSLTEIVVENTDIREGTKQGVVVLRELKQNRYMSIQVAGAEAHVIANKPQDATYEQLPCLYNLLKNIIMGLGASITMIVISELIEETFYGNIVLKIIDKQLEFDVHAVDCIALARYTNTPIFIEEDVLERATIIFNQREEIKEEVIQSTQIDTAGSDASQLPPPTPPTTSDRDRFDKFTERGRKVLNLAQEEAQRFQHNYIGTEHLLLGLVREGEGVAAKVLANLGVELNKVRSAVEFIIGRGDRIVLGQIGLTPQAKKVIELSVDEARRLNHYYIGSEHLLLGIIREGEGTACGILESLGVNLEKVRTQTIQVLSQSSVRNN